MKKVMTVLFSMVLVLSFAGSALAADVQVKKAGTAPVIDGKIDDVWKEATVYEVKNVVIENGLTGDSDLAGKWRMLWDDNHLYVLVEVSDDVLINDVTEGNENNDNAEIYVNANNDSGSSYTNSVHSLTLTYGKTEVLGWTGTFGPLNAEGMKLASTQTDNGYIVEAAFPWENLNAVDIAAGKPLGIDVHLNDNDGGKTRDHKMATFATEDMSWSNPSLFGSAVLSGEVAGASSAAPVVPDAMPKTGLGGTSPMAPSAELFIVVCLLSVAVILSTAQWRKRKLNR